MAIFHNAPVRIPMQDDFDLPIGVSRTVKVIISADTNLVADSNAYNVMLNDSADADTDLNMPLFLLRSGVMVEDLGIECFQVFTEAASLILGDTVDSDGWVDTASWNATDTQALGNIRWMGVMAAKGWALSTAFLDDTTASFGPAYFDAGDTGSAIISGHGGPRVVYADSAYSTAVIVGITSDEEPRPDEYAIIFHQKEAVAVTGGVSIYLRYNLAPMSIREPSSNLGTTGD